MARRDIYHDTVKHALQNDGWRITDDPFWLKIGRKRLAIDLGAELIRAKKGSRKILVEVKSFIGHSDIRDLEQALGQYILYYQILQEKHIDRDLYLGITQSTYKSVFQTKPGSILLKNSVMKLLVVDEYEEVITQWVPR